MFLRSFVQKILHFGIMDLLKRKSPYKMCSLIG